MRILFGGSVSRPSQSGAQRLTAMRQCGHLVTAVEDSPFWRTLPRLQVFLGGGGYDAALAEGFNRQLLEQVRTADYDLVWLEWPRMVTPETIAALRQLRPGIPIISFQDDNPFGGRFLEERYWQTFFEAIPAYDLHFVKRQSDVVELGKRGARAVELFEHGTFPEVFFPPAAGERPEQNYEVSFVGTALDRRVRTIAQLQLQYRLPVHVFGNRWHRHLAYHLRRGLYHGEVTEGRYRQAILASKISLGFISHSNRDEYSMRSFEIPACGGFFLAERTPRHQELYREGVEADFFSDAAECARKIDYYLKHDEARDTIAAAGCRRAHSPEYSLRYRIGRAVQRAQALRVSGKTTDAPR